VIKNEKAKQREDNAFFGAGNAIETGIGLFKNRSMVNTGGLPMRSSTMVGVGKLTQRASE
jgi:hypothetical protein